ncbi:MAG: GNAT family N-acetyltransferase [Solobacterium sp.]|nr:GNAT family N-acetyltransferase [Solobacterium sp.]MBQ6355524.1 GNAT family N-acetyltransferase [Solobacterium sp.]MBQ6532734.1 GNAT family N-acetyltransferase [Solobacterium sp.]MBR0213769.1 GNAT family N-acetyltransferase [Solobacterium sp.]
MMNETVKLLPWLTARGKMHGYVQTFVRNGGRVLECSADTLVMVQEEADMVFALGQFRDTEEILKAGTLMTDRKDWFEEKLAGGQYAGTLIARNAVYMKDLPPEEIILPGTSFRMLDEKDLPFVQETYTGFDADDAYLKRCLRRGMIGIEAEGQLAGYIGTHDEGAMGLLQILPQYRRRHYAEALETAMIRFLMADGRAVWGQVEESNTASRRLQEKLGFAWGDLYYWLFRE